MIATLFPTFQDSEVPLVGRVSDLRKLWSELSKRSPSNIKLVAPKHMGKSVLLKALCHVATENAKPFRFVVYWDLGQRTPESDKDFINECCRLLQRQLVGVDEYREWHDYLSDASMENFVEVAKALNGNELPFLFVLDGIDKVLSRGTVSGTLFNQLRDVFHASKNRVVVSSRLSPTDLARDQQVYDSPFWNLFPANSTRLYPFTKDDIDALLASRSIASVSGAVPELLQLTGGLPFLVVCVLNCFLSESSESSLSHSQVLQYGQLVVSNMREYFIDFWKQCNAETTELFRLVQQSPDLLASSILEGSVDNLLNQGLVRREGNKLKTSCRLLADTFANSKQDLGAKGRMFGTWDKYRVEIRDVLDLRLRQIPIIDNRLWNLVKNSITFLPDYPDDCLSSLNSIETVAIDLIWKYEFDGTRTIGKAIVNYWVEEPRCEDNIVKGMPQTGDWRLPNDHYKQLALLQRLTGCKPDFDSKARFVTKDSYVLLDAIHSFRNRTVHSEGQEIHNGVAVSAILLCIELLGCLSRELTAT